MNAHLPIVLLCLMFVLPVMSWAGEYPERWNYVSGNILTQESTEKLIGLIRQSKEVGCTHVLWSGCRGPRIPELTDAQSDNARRVQEEAKKLGIKIVPGIFSVGYSGRYFHFDSIFDLERGAWG